MESRRQDVRNIAIIAHVDHGKTTLVDGMLRQTGEFTVKADEAQEAVLDSNPIERERGITILSKCTSVPYKGHTLNIVDTPGHADFGSEVERILQMVDGALLLVDAVDGPMPQTRFVLRKALQLGLAPIVVINKLDRANARPHKVLDMVFSLFVDLGASDPQLDFPIIYAAGKEGWATLNSDQPGKDLAPLFEVILQHVPPPAAHAEKPLQMLVTMVDYSSYLGQIGVGRIVNGKVSKAQGVVVVKPGGKITPCKVTRLERFFGLTRREVDSALAGDIVAVAGLTGVEVGDTLALPEFPESLPPLAIDEPTLSMEFLINDSPFAGTEGKFVTSRHLKARLEKEQVTNVGLKIEELPGEGKFKVSGRGELHLTILIETMRREGYELAVSRPEVVYREEEGKVLEPTEYLVIDIPGSYQGVVFDNIGRRGGTMKNMTSEGADRLRLEYVVPSRALIGFKSEFLTQTKGEGIMHHSFHGYGPKSGELGTRGNGVFVCKETGLTTGYALYNLQDRAVMFLGPGVKVYEGMICGQNSRGNDLVVNPCKLKAMSNMRSKATDDALVLTPPRLLTLEQAIEFIAEDELVEVTPRSIRLRKKVRDYSNRKRVERIEEREEEREQE
ncbi:MAG: GTP-binding protein TypA [Elusimicrobia bacterium GWA2_69_24]|nr:MAG: GTP-binding protein TypA [Elusimicrobia bacterium GWA2_69_24]